MTAALLLLALQAPSALHVDGPSLVDAGGRRVLLRGVSLADPRAIAHERPGGADDGVVADVAAWGANLVRIPIHPGTWKDEGRERVFAWLDLLFDACARRGIYAILDWHAIGNPHTGVAQEPAHEYDSRADLALEFWRAAAERYGARSHVLFELFNEPAGVSWARWKPIAESWIDAIRPAAPETLVLVGGVFWSSNLSWALASPIDRPQIAYVAHIYPAHARERWDELFGDMARRFPVVMTEWGFQAGPPAHLVGGADDYGRPLVEYVSERGIHWAAWVWHPSWDPPLLRDWSGRPTEFGEVVREALRR